MGKVDKVAPHITCCEQHNRVKSAAQNSYFIPKMFA